ncbi:MAG: hypothetical protein ACRYFX_29930 [Janthinobacterium lividum]
MEPPVPPPKNKKSITWPILVNLVLLVVVVALFDGNLEVLPWAVAGLAFINGIAAFIMLISGNRLHFVVAFALSCLVILLVGFGACALMLKNWHGGGH